MTVKRLRLTQHDWSTINEALALLEATPLSALGYDDDDENMAKAIAQARRKVWQRMDD